MKGFSLIELIVVLALLGLMASAVAPALARATIRAPLEQATSAISDTIRAVRREALLRGRNVSVVIDPSTSRFWVTGQTLSGADSLRTGRWSLPDNVTLLHPRNRVELRFGPVDALQADSFVVRHGAAMRTIGVDRWTGAVSVR